MTTGERFFPAGAYCILVAFSIFLPIVIHLVISRRLVLYRAKALRQKGAIMSIIAGVLPLAGLFIVLETAMGGKNGLFWRSFYLLGVYFLFGYVYFHVFNMSETARRIRILAHGHREGKVVKEELTQNYTRKQMVEIRIARLLALGELHRRNSNFIIGRGLLLMPARAVFAFRRTIFPKESR